MKKGLLLAMVYLSATVFYLATPACAMNEPASSPVQRPYQQMVSDRIPVIPELQAAESNSLFARVSGISDEAWLFCTAMLALAGLFIIHKTTR